MIIQQDREYAASLAGLVYGKRVADAILAGETDWHHFVKAFKEHREKIEEKNTEASWEDRSGGQFTVQEIADYMNSRIMY